MLTLRPCSNKCNNKPTFPTRFRKNKNHTHIAPPIRTLSASAFSSWIVFDVAFYAVYAAPAAVSALPPFFLFIQLWTRNLPPTSPPTRLGLGPVKFESGSGAYVFRNVYIFQGQARSQKCNEAMHFCWSSFEEVVAADARPPLGFGFGSVVRIVSIFFSRCELRSNSELLDRFIDRYRRSRTLVKTFVCYG